MSEPDALCFLEAKLREESLLLIHLGMDAHWRVAATHLFPPGLERICDRGVTFELKPYAYMACLACKEDVYSGPYPVTELQLEKAGDAMLQHRLLYCKMRFHCPFCHVAKEDKRHLTCGGKTSGLQWCPKCKRVYGYCGACNDKHETTYGVKSSEPSAS